MYRIVFVSRSRSFVVVKELASLQYYVFDYRRLLDRVSHWTQCATMLSRAYKEGSAEKLVFEKSECPREELLHEILQEAYSEGFYQHPVKDFGTLQEVWKWVYEEDERITLACRKMPYPASVFLKQRRMVGSDLLRLFQWF